MITTTEDEEIQTWNAEVISRDNINAEDPPAVTSNPMLLHCGGEIISRRDLSTIPTPEGTRTWYPLAHNHLVKEVEAQLAGGGFRVTAQTHAISHEGHRYFGVMEVQSHTAPVVSHTDKSHCWIIGLRNSHDKQFPAGLTAGTRVFVCDNLCFSGEVRISRKHTRYAQRDLKHMCTRAVGQLHDRFGLIDQRIEAYKAKTLRNREVHDIAVKALDCQVIGSTQLPAVIQHWRKPAYEEFSSRNVWSLQNAFTEVFKDINPNTAIRRCESLHGLLDGVCGIALEA